MKKITIEVKNFNSCLAEREAFCMCRRKHVGNVRLRNLYTSHNPYESTDEVEFPISVEMVVCRKYVDDAEMGFSVSRIQNGKIELLCERSDYRDSLEENYYSYFDEFNETIKALEKRGFTRL